MNSLFKYNYLKNKGLNKLFNLNLDFLPLNFIENTIIHSNSIYIISKENITNLYIMSFEYVTVYCLDTEGYLFFSLLYTNSVKFSFEVYSNSDETEYIIFCTSHKNLSELLSYNDNKYNILHQLYGHFLIINRKFYCKYLKYNHVKTIGNGKRDQSLYLLVKCIINIVNNYYLKTLPPHYVNI